MTPFGAKLRELRRKQGRSLKHMASSLDVSSSYLSALERGTRGKPTWAMIQRVIQYFNIIWDEADEVIYLAEMSDPKIKINTADGLPEATMLVNKLSKHINQLTKQDIMRLLKTLDELTHKTKTDKA